MEQQTQTEMKFHFSSHYQGQKSFDQIVYKEAKQTIFHLKRIARYLETNIPDPLKISNKKVANNNKKQNKSQLSLQDTQSRVIVQRYFEQVSTSGKQLYESLYDTAKKFESFLSQEMDYTENQQPNLKESHHSVLRRSYSAINQNEQKLRGQQIAQIFSYMNRTYFSQPFLQKLLNDKLLKKLAIYILGIETKLSTVPIFLQSITNMKQDITVCQPFCQAYKHVWKHVVMINAGDKEMTKSQKIRQKAREDYYKLKLMMKVTTAAVVTQKMTTQIQWIRKIVFGLSFPRFIFSQQEAQLRCYKIWRCPEVNQLNSVWNLSERGALRHLKNIIFPNIKTKLQIFIPTLSKEQVEKMIVNKGSNNWDIYPKGLNIFQAPQNSQSVPVLILHADKVQLLSQFESYGNFYCPSCLQSPLDDYFESIVIHIHGGGFIALSSDTMQSYTRRWANGLKVPVFSINYRKPPKHRFPDPAFDCLSTYIFVVSQIQKYMNIRPKKIVIAGDSAGGNLACALVALLIKINYPVLPTGIYLAYPAVDMRQRYSPSRLNAFQDALLLPTLLLLCQKEYIGNNSINQYEPLASPLLLTDEYIQSDKLFLSDIKKSGKKQNKDDYKFPKNWPKTVIMVGNKDPLYDDSLRLLDRLVNSGIQVKMLLYRDFSHGFLSLDGIIPACNQTIEESIVLIRQLLQN